MVESEFMAEMTFDSDFQELRISDDRKKIDVFEAILDQSRDQKHLQSDSKFNVRNSLAWDSAFFTSPGVLEPDELFRSVNSRIGGNEVDIFGHEEEILLASGTLEPPVKCRVDKCDLRKSLAWNDAFFTNAGVLDPEELSIVNRGFKNPKTRLTGIEEDVTKSTESSLSIESGASSLKSLEIDLFEDMRVSRHKSNFKFSVSESNIELQRRKDKVDAFSRTKIKGIPVSRRQNIISNSAERYTKKTSLSAPSQKQLSAGNSSVKPPKSADRLRNISPVLNKKVSFREFIGKVGTPKVASAESRLTNPKKITPVNSKSFCHCSTPSSKSYSSGFPVLTHKPVSSLLSKSGSTFRTPSRYSTRNKSEPQSSCHSSQELSVTKPSCFTSPESSADGWSSGSSSTSVAKRPNNPKAFLGTTCRQVHFEGIVSQDSPLTLICPNQPSTTRKSQGKSPSDHRDNKTPLRTVSFPSRMSRNTKPRSLQSPLPKLGYSDEVNSSVPIRNRSSQFNSGKQIETAKPRIARTMAQHSKQSYSALQITRKNPEQVIEVQDENSNSATIRICFPTASKVENDSEDCLVAKKSEESECYEEGSVEKNPETESKEIILLQKSSTDSVGEFKKKMHFSLDESNKENIYCFRDQVDDLGTRFGTIDFGGDLVIEVKVKKTSPDSQSAVLTLKL